MHASNLFPDCLTALSTYTHRALSVHKCQGTTISSVELKIDNAFDYGQAYVGLSRVTTIDGLWLTTALTPRSIKADPLALEYYNYSSFDDLNDST